VAASAEDLVGASTAASAGLAVISRPLLFISKRCLRSRLFTNSRVAFATPPGRLEASTLSGLDFAFVAILIAELDFKGFHAVRLLCGDSEIGWCVACCMGTANKQIPRCARDDNDAWGDSELECRGSV
jgi:hypothetical protein